MSQPPPGSKPSTPVPSTPLSSSSVLSPPSSRPTTSSGLRTPSNRKTIYDRNLNRTRTAELSKASFAYLFSEMVSYAQKRVTGIQDLEKRLNEQGYPIGLRLLSLLLYREPPRTATRPTRILPLLQFITTTLWRHLFGRPADALERSSTNANEYMISDNDPLVNAYISIPKEMSQLNCAAFVAGIIEGVCDAGALTAKVSAHNAGEPGGMWPGKTVFLIKFEEEIVKRDSLLEVKK